jgi:hypothetical protein
MLVDLLFWGVVAAFVVHVLDEALLGGGFVAKVKQHWWPEYRADMFFWFNTGFIACMVVFVLLYEIFGGAWVILPLYWAFERGIHGLTFNHWWSIKYREYSPGLLSSVLLVLVLYLITRFGLLAGSISPIYYLIGGIAGALGAFALALLPTRIMPAIYAAREQRAQSTP